MENRCRCCLDCTVFNYLFGNLMRLIQQVTFKYILAQTKGYEYHESVPSSTTLYLILVVCLIAVAKHPKRSNKQKGLQWLRVWRVKVHGGGQAWQSSWWLGHFSGTPPITVHQESKRNAGSDSHLSSSLVIFSIWDPSHGLLIPLFKVGLLSSRERRKHIQSETHECQSSWQVKWTINEP